MTEIMNANSGFPESSNILNFADGANDVTKCKIACNEREDCTSITYGVDAGTPFCRLIFVEAIRLDKVAD